MARKVVRKRRVKKNIPLGVAHIHSTFNNTITSYHKNSNFSTLKLHILTLIFCQVSE